MSTKLELLFRKAQYGSMTPEEQKELASEAMIYHDMAVRLERALHEILKEVEHDAS